MSEPIDPDKTTELLKDIYRTAAEKSTGPGKPNFERLSKTFNELVDAIDANAERGFVSAKFAFDAAMLNVRAFAHIDRDSAKTLLWIHESIDKEERGEYIPARKPRRPGKSGHCHV